MSPRRASIVGMPETSTTERTTFRAAADADGVAPLLEGRLRRPASPAAGTGVAILAHPHPEFGGNMDVWMLPTIGARLSEDGWTVLRFNVRGVGRSQAGPGRWDGEAERLDLAGAVDHAVGHTPRAGPVALVGWSFGALLGLLHGPEDPRVTHWVGIAPPTQPLAGVAMVDVEDSSIAAWRARRTVIVGEHDQHFPPGSVDRLTPHEVRIVAGADHFFFDRDREVAEHVAGCLR